MTIHYVCTIYHRPSMNFIIIPKVTMWKQYNYNHPFHTSATSMVRLLTKLHLCINVYSRWHVSCNCMIANLSSISKNFKLTWKIYLRNNIKHEQPTFYCSIPGMIRQVLLLVGVWHHLYSPQLATMVRKYPTLIIQKNIMVWYDVILRLLCEFYQNNSRQ